MDKKGDIKAFVILGSLLLLGAGYYFFMKAFGFGLVCPINHFTGYRCITCGITHLFIDLARLDIRSAWHDNQFVFLTLPLIIYEIVTVTWRFSHKRKLPRFTVILMYVHLAAGFVFMFLRNIFMW